MLWCRRKGGQAGGSASGQTRQLAGAVVQIIGWGVTVSAFKAELGGAYSRRDMDAGPAWFVGPDAEPKRNWGGKQMWKLRRQQGWAQHELGWGQEWNRGDTEVGTDAGAEMEPRRKQVWHLESRDGSSMG